MDTVIKLHAYAVYSLRQLGAGSRTIGKMNDLLRACADECGAMRTAYDALAAENGTLRAERDLLQSRLASATSTPIESIASETNQEPQALVVDAPIVVTDESLAVAETIINDVPTMIPPAE